MSGLAEILEENARLRAELAAASARLGETESRLGDTESRLGETESRLGDTESRLGETESRLGETEAMLQQTAAERDVAVAEVDRLERVLELIRLEAAGPKSERYVPDRQVPMFEGPVPPPPRAPVSESPSDEDESETAEGPGKKKNRGKSRGGKTSRRRTREDFAGMPSRKVVCPVGEVACRACHKPMEVFDTAASFRIEWVPGHFEVHDVLREKCSCPSCPEQGVFTAPGPYALDRCLAGNGLLARVVCDKFADHIPANRQAKRMTREGFEVGSHTVSSWICRVGSLLHPIALAVRDEVLTASCVQGDDTGMPVQDGGDGTLRRGRMWAFTDQHQVFYAFTETKEGRFPNALLEGFDGKLLLVDGGSEFNEVVRQRGLAHGGCWSHLRSKFFKALPDHPREAELALGTLRDLFAIEAEIWGAPPGEVLAERLTRSKPLVDGFFDWVRGVSQLARPKSRLATAVGYALNQEAEMRRFLDHGEMPLHNNLSELMLRQTVVGRKNWLFSRSEGGALAAADLYTLIGSCMLQGVDPQNYLQDVMVRVLDHPSSRLHELTPRGWRAMRQPHTLG